MLQRDRGLRRAGFDLDQVYCGDCLDLLQRMPAECVALVYIDPPFGSGKRYRLPRHGLSFGDTHGGSQAYLDYMAPRLSELYRVLKPTGTLWYHCDWHASHYVKVLLDQIFGRAHFLNEVIWHYGLGGSSRRYFPRKHDSLFWYAKDSRLPYTFNPPLTPATSQKLRGQQKKLDDVWDIPAVNNMARERTGYPTQKPLELLRRVIAASSNPGDLVLDAFCGSGTTLAAARDLGRRFIGIDSSADACLVARQRLGIPAPKPPP